MTTENKTTTEVVHDTAPQKENKKRGRKPAAKKLQKAEVNATAKETKTNGEIPQDVNVTDSVCTEANVVSNEAIASGAAPKKASKPRPTRRKKEATQQTEVKQEETPQEIEETPAPVITEEPKVEEREVAAPVPSAVQTAPATAPKPEPREIKVPTLPSIKIRNIIELAQAPQRSIILTDQQIQTLTIEEIDKRHKFLEETLVNILDYDVVISDTNIWLELLIGHTSSHSDPRFNARLQFERQLEFISRLTKYRGGRFMIMGETYEEIDRFASMQDPTNHREADWTDNIVCLNAAARLAKRLILVQQRENRLRIEGIGAESHHAAFADPAIVRKVAELFAQGKKVLLLTNDASVAIRSMGICDDLQRHNNISDSDWDEKYAPLRPMVFTFDDLKLLDYYTRQYHYIQMAAGEPWMCDASRSMPRSAVEPLTLWQDAFRPGDKHRGENLFSEQEKQQVLQQQKQKQEQQQKQKQEQQQKQKQEQQQKQKQQAQQKQKQQQQSKPQKQEHENIPEQPATATEAPVDPQPQSATPLPPTATEQQAAQVEQKPVSKPRTKSRRRPQKSKNAAAAQQDSAAPKEL